MAIYGELHTAQCAACNLLNYHWGNVVEILGTVQKNTGRVITKSTRSIHSGRGYQDDGPFFGPFLAKKNCFGREKASIWIPPAPPGRILIPSIRQI